MALISRIKKLEDIIPPPIPTKPKRDYSALSIDEHYFLIRHWGTLREDGPQFYSEKYYQPYDDMQPEERQRQLDLIWAKVKWEE